VSILFRKGLLNAKLETTFRTDADPSDQLLAATGINATSDVNDVNEQVTVTGHGFQSGDGPFHLTITSGALPTGLAIATNYWVNRVGANEFTFHTTEAAARAGTSAINLTDATGVFAMTARQSDALLVQEPDFTPEITTVERENVKSTLSQDPIRVARKTGTVTFQHEVRSNGITDGTLEPAVGRLLRGCGYAPTFIPTGTGTIVNDVTYEVNDPTGVFTFSKTTGFGGTLPRTVVMQCTTGGGTGVAEFTVFSPAVGTGGGTQAEVNTTGNVLTETSAFTLAESAQITVPSGGITTSFATGDTYVFWLVPPGVLYTPVSSNFDSLTLELFFDGIKHEVRGSRGTFTLDAPAADIARFTFTFQGDYIDPSDSAQPASPVLESTIPPAVEEAAIFALGGADFDGTDPDEFNLCAQQFTIDQANELAFRECINAPNSIEGGLIVDRSPVGTFNPETELEATHPFWTNLGDANRVVWGGRVGKVQGNVMSIFAPYTQYQGISYGNRNDIRTYEIDLWFARESDAGNDELMFHFS
jgi:hypothetical protein